ncbi:MAG TPA: glycosyltransferase [Candidatus Saccharimonadales bacterium]|nr:glycosyltransferase [Candidatus Saccharimonadales bacterium]
MRRAIITTSWDDGHKLDMRLVALLRKYNIKATIYVSPNDREFPKKDMLTDAQIKAISNDFEIGAHTMTHPRLTEVDDERALKEMVDSKDYLERVTKKPVTTFCYPGGNYFKKHVEMARRAGFAYARTVKRHFYNLRGSLQESHTTVNAYDHYQDLWKIFKFAGYNPFKVPYYFRWQNLAMAMFDKVQKDGGIFHLWGHSWEIDKHGDWEKLEEVLAHISGHDNVTYATNGELPALAKPSVLIATPYYPPLVGGVEHYAHHMARGAHDDGYDVTVVTSTNEKTMSMRDEDGVRVYRLPTQFTLMNTPIGLAWYSQIKQIIRREDPDVINAHGPVPFLPDIAIAAARGRRRIVTYHSGTMRKGWPVVDWMIGLYENVWLPSMLVRADRILCSSDFVRDGFLKHYKTKSETVTPGVDTTVFTKRASAPHGKRVLFVGNFRNGIKGLQFLQQAVEMLPGVELHVVGEGERTPSERTVYHGALRGQELVDQYHAADVMVLPSIGSTESFGMVLIEAMACGVPVIGSDVGGIPTVISDGIDGLIVPPSNAEALAAAIQNLLENTEKADQLADQAYHKVQRKFTWEKSVRKYLSALNRVRAHAPTIVHVAGYYPPHLGGMEKVAQSVAEGIADRDYSVRVLTSDFPHDTSTPANQNLTVKRHHGFEFAHTPFAYGFIGSLFGVPKNSVVHLHLAQAFYPEWVWLVCKVRRIPYIVHFHLDLQPSGPLGRIFVVYKATILKMVIRSANKVTVFSKEQKKFIQDTYQLPSRDIVIIPNGVGEEYFAKPRTYKSGARTLLFVGRLAPQKRVDRIIGAMAQLKTDARLVIVGDGEDRAKLEQQVQDLKLGNVEFVGQKNAAETRDYYAQADVLVQPSDREGMSLVTLEAMASALPIVASHAEGLAELLKGVGVLVKKPSPATFAKALNDVLPKPAELAKLSRQSVEAAKPYAWPTVTDMFEELYKEVKP